MFLRTAAGRSPLSHPKTPLDPETYDGAPLIYLHTTAQQTQRKNKKKSLGLIPPLVGFIFFFFKLRPFLTPTETRRLSWLQLPTFEGGCAKGGVWGAVGCRRSS